MIMGKKCTSESAGPEFKSQVCYLLVLWFLDSFWTFKVLVICLSSRSFDYKEQKPIQAGWSMQVFYEGTKESHGTHVHKI